MTSANTRERERELPEEREPCGVELPSGLHFTRCVGWQRRAVVWEPLPTRAPRPSRTMPHCCYSSTVIFYQRRRARSRAYGHFVLGPGRSFKEWDHVEHKLLVEDIVRIDGELWSVAPGDVVWRGGRWWMRYTLWRVDDANRLFWRARGIVDLATVGTKRALV